MLCADAGQHPAEPLPLQPGPPAVQNQAGGLALGPGADKLADDYDVLMAHLVFLQREPENSSEIQTRLNRPIREILQEFLAIGQFQGLIAQPLERGATLVHAASGTALTSEQVSWLVELLALPEEQRAALKRGASRRTFVLVHLDAPVARAVVAGMLAGSGWIIATSDIERIAIFLNDKRLCSALIKPPPSDLAKRFHHYARARRAGFDFSANLGSRDITGDRSTLTVAVHTADGAKTHKIIPVTVQAGPGDASAPSPIRSGQALGKKQSRLAQSYIKARYSILRRAGYYPFYLILIRASGDSAEDAEQVHATLQTLHEQAYDSWRAVVLLSERRSEALVAARVAGIEARLLARVRFRSADPAGSGDLLRWPDLADPSFLVVLRAGDELGADALLGLATASATDRTTELITNGKRPVAAPGISRQHDNTRKRSRGLSYLERGWCAARRLVEAAGITVDLLLSADDEEIMRRFSRAASGIGARVHPGS